MATADNLTEDYGVTRPWVYIVLGLFSVAVGVVALTHPKDSLLVLGLLFGVLVLVWGSAYLVTAFEKGLSAGQSALLVFVGLFGLVAGLFAVVHPGESVIVLLLAIGFWFIITGAAEVAHGFSHSEHRLLYILIGLVSIAAGVIVISDPDIGLRTLALLFGLGFIVRGVISIALGFAVKRA